MEENFTEKLKQASTDGRFSKHLGLRPIEVKPGYAKVELTVQDEHLNLHGTCHGAVIFAALDEAFQLASNSHGTAAMALSVSINYLRPAKKGDVLAAEASEVDKTRRTGNYRFLVKNQAGESVTFGHGLVYRKDDELKL